MNLANSLKLKKYQSKEWKSIFIEKNWMGIKL
jgi:hypothetical protein